MFSSREFILGGGVAIAALAGALMFTGSHPSNGSESGLSGQMFGTWKTGCGRDAMTDKGFCFLTSAVPGQGPFSHTTLQLTAISTKPNAAYVEFIEPSFGWKVTGISVRFDDGPVQNIACSESNSNSCGFIGKDRELLTSGLEQAHGLRVRLTILNGRTYDFVYDLTGYHAAEAAFIHSAQRL